MILRKALRIIAALAIVIMITSCASTEFTEKVSTQDNEMTAFKDVSLDAVSMNDVQQLGNVEAKRTVVYTLQQNGDYTIEMDGFNYSFTAEDGTAVVSGTRVIGSLKGASMAGGATVLVSGGSFFENLFGGAAAEANVAAPSVATMSPKTIALEAVNYDLMQAAAAKGGIALLLPDYSWEIEEELTGTEKAAFLFVPASKIYETKNLTYTVTARASAVSF